MNQCLRCELFIRKIIEGGGAEKKGVLNDVLNSRDGKSEFSSTLVAKIKVLSWRAKLTEGCLHEEAHGEGELK